MRARDVVEMYPSVGLSTIVSTARGRSSMPAEGCAVTPVEEWFLSKGEGEALWRSETFGATPNLFNFWEVGGSMRDQGPRPPTASAPPPD